MDQLREALKYDQQALNNAAMENQMFTGSGQAKLQQTLGIIKPEAIHRAEHILNIIRREGLTVLQTREVELSLEVASQFYQDQHAEEGFSANILNLCSGPIYTMILSGPGAIEHWLQLVGPEKDNDRQLVPDCLRAIFGVNGSDEKNGLHGSKDEDDSLREIHFFFPEFVLEPVSSDCVSSCYLNEFVHPVLTVGLSKMIRDKPADPIIWLADWLIANNPNKAKEFGSGNTCN